MGPIRTMSSIVWILLGDRSPERSGETINNGGVLDTGHYLAEEAPLAVIEAFERHFV